ncbi:hypothetical protein CR513_24420, partial [Mucuna pruriens]
MSFKTCYSFWTNAKDVFTNDVQHLFDSTQKIVSLTNHDMVSHIAKARATTEELKAFRLLRVPTITKGDGIAVENFAMVVSRGRGRSGRGTRGMLRNGKGGCDERICSHCGKEEHLQNRCYDLISWLDKTANISSSNIPSNGRIASQLILDEEFKSNNHTQSSASPSPWEVDLGASDHISGNDYVFSSISSPKFPYFISLANGSKMVSRGVGQVSLSSSISLNFELYIPKCPYNLVSLSQLTRSLNCSVTFDADSFVIQDRNTDQLIGEGHE